MTTTDIRTGQQTVETQSLHADPEQTTRTDQGWIDAHDQLVGAGLDPHNEDDLDREYDSRHAIPEPTPIHQARGGLDHPTGQRRSDDQTSSAGGAQSTAAAISTAETRKTPPLPPSSPNGHPGPETHGYIAVGGTDSATPAKTDSEPTRSTPDVAGEQGQPARASMTPSEGSLADPTLALLADVLDDLERTRIANENRLRQLTRDEPDKDGEERGFGLTEDHPDVARLASVVRGIAELEHQATLNLARVMRAHDLGPWVKAQKGVGEKQAARLLAAIGDPYWNYLHDRPRTVSELWAYCGLHVVAGGDHATADTQRVGVAARRKKGERANWSTAAKMRAWNIAGSMLKAGNRETYDKRKAATEGRLHAAPCVRCGPSGKPAQPGSPWSDAHRHADALRIVSKELLKQLWLAARDIHHGQAAFDIQIRDAVVEQP